MDSVGSGVVYLECLKNLEPLREGGEVREGGDVTEGGGHCGGLVTYQYSYLPAASLCSVI